MRVFYAMKTGSRDLDLASVRGGCVCICVGGRGGKMWVVACLPESAGREASTGDLRFEKILLWWCGGGIRVVVWVVANPLLTYHDSQIPIPKPVSMALNTLIPCSYWRDITNAEFDFLQKMLEITFKRLI